MDVLYQMLRESHLFRKKLIYLTCNNGQPLLTLATTVTCGFPLQCDDHTQGVEFKEKACGVMYELLAVTEQACWPAAKRINVSTTWFVESLITKDKMVCQH